MIEIKRGWKIATFDIETTSLEAEYGYMVCVVVRDFHTGRDYTIRIDDKENPDHSSDKWVVEQTLKRLSEYDLLVSWNGQLFDKPFINTRAILNGLRTPLGKFYHRDLLLVARARFRVYGNKLMYWRRRLFGKSDKTHTTPKLKNDTIKGKKYAIDFVVNHCRIDVKETEELYRKFLPYLSENVKKS